MGLITEIGTVTRALPNEDGLSIKLQSQTGAHELEVPANRPELIEAARDARMTGEEVLVRRTADGMVVALQPNVIGVAA